MASDETGVQIVVVAVVIATLVALGWVGTQLDGTLRVAVWLLVNFVVFGGTHLYLAVSGEGGEVPVRSRWRYVGTLAVVFGVAPLVAFGIDAWFSVIEGTTVGVVIAIGTVLAFLITEAASGYRESRPE